MKVFIKQHILRPLKSLILILLEIECKIASLWVSSSHNRLFRIQWNIEPNPEFFDHNINLYYQWRADRNPLWVERGVFGCLALKRNGSLLELACGDGFNTRHFYSIISGSVVACDFDKAAITTAIRKNSAPNINFVLADIREKMPEGTFDNIVFDAAIEHFTPAEIEFIMSNIKSRLTPTGILSGYTIVEKGHGEKFLTQHEYEFKDMDDLKRFLTPYFKNVKVFETIYPTRHNLYFWASDSTLPFDKSWTHMSN